MIKDGHRHDDAGLSLTLSRIPGLTGRHLLKKPYRFQVPPLDEFGYDASHSWLDYETVEGGQYTRDGKKLLKTLTFDTLAMDFSPRWAAWAGGDHHEGRGEPDGRGTNPQDVDDDFDELGNDGTPFQLTAWNRALYRKPMINMPVTLRSWSTRERAGEPDAHYYSLAFTQYRTPEFERRGYGKGGGGDGFRHDLPATVKIDKDGKAFELQHDGKGHDEKRIHDDATGMRDLARYFYGQTGYWTYIQRKNGVKGIGPNENLGHLVQKGRKFRTLTVPALSRVGGEAGGRGEGSRNTGRHDG